MDLRYHGGLDRHVVCHWCDSNVGLECDETQRARKVDPMDLFGFLALLRLARHDEFFLEFTRSRIHQNKQ